MEFIFQSQHSNTVGKYYPLKKVILVCTIINTVDLFNRIPKSDRKQKETKSKTKKASAKKWGLAHVEAQNVKPPTELSDKNKNRYCCSKCHSTCST